MGDFLDYVEKERHIDKHLAMEELEVMQTHSMAEKNVYSAEDEIEYQYNRFARKRQPQNV